jgi:hypothetical protein
MVSAARRRTMLAVVRTDSTFERAGQRGQPVRAGKCIHCNATAHPARPVARRGGLNAPAMGRAQVAQPW